MTLAEQYLNMCEVADPVLKDIKQLAKKMGWKFDGVTKGPTYSVSKYVGAGDSGFPSTMHKYVELDVEILQHDTPNVRIIAGGRQGDSATDQKNSMKLNKVTEDALVKMVIKRIGDKKFRVFEIREKLTLLMKVKDSEYLKILKVT